MQTPGPDTSPRREGSREPVEDPAERAARAAVGPAAVEPDPSGDGPDPAAAEPPSLVAVDVLARWLGLAAGPDADAGQPAPAFDARRDPGRLVLLDVRYSVTGGGSGHEEYLHGHLPLSLIHI